MKSIRKVMGIVMAVCFMMILLPYTDVNATDKSVLTAEEQAYVQEKGSIRVAVIQNAVPFSYYDEDKYVGIAVESVEAVAATIGLQVEYIQAEDAIEAASLLRNGEADVISDFYADDNWSREYGVILTEPYLEVAYAQVTLKQKEIQPDEAKVAVCTGSYFNEIYVQDSYEPEQIVYYATEAECVEAVKRAEADVAYVSRYAAEILLRQDTYLKLDKQILYNTSHGVVMAVAHEDENLLLLLNKGIQNLEPGRIAQIADKYESVGEDKVSLRRFIYYNPIPIIVGMAVVAVVLLGILVYALLQKKKYDKYIYELAYKDPLSQLGNVNLLEDYVAKKRQDYIDKEVILISLDINHFTTIKESYGKNVGDQVISYVASGLRELAGNKGIVVRNEGDNFVLFGVYTSEQVEKLIDSVRTQINLFHYEKEGTEEEINISYFFGIVKETLRAGSSVHQMIDRATMARKMAKREKTAVYYFDDALEQQLFREKMLEDRMESALENGEFTVYYQPKFRMTDNAVIGAEALVRWNSKEYGFMNPGEFVPLFESNGFILELDFYCMEQVYKMLRQRLDAGLKVVRISINQSRLHFGQKNYIARLNALRDKYQIPGELIELELTESIFADMQDISRGVEELKSNGYYLSVDDFGSGYSSLNMIKDVPIDTLKIDKDFLSDDDQESGRYQKVIRKVVELAKELNMNIICEGVEREEQADFLQSVGCMYAQGFLYAKPMPETDFMDLLEKEGCSQ